VQYTHARIKSILRKASGVSAFNSASSLLKLEKDLLLLLEQYSDIVEDATKEFNPASIAVYAFNVAKTFNSFYSEHSVMNAESEEKKALRLKLCERTAETIKHAMGLLGIRVPERM
jgi:arginyl-tRNA synthetase